MALDDTATVSQGNSVIIPVLYNDYDEDGDSLTVRSVRRAKGVVHIQDDGTLLYRPTPNFVGEDAFEYTITDGKKGKASAWVRVQVRAAQANQDPVAVDDTYSTDEDATLTVNAELGLLANDSDEEGDALTAVLIDGPANGQLILNPDGSFSYSPEADYNGSDSFTYTISDGNGGSASATVTVTVNPVNDAPVITSAASATATEDVPFSYTATATDVDGDVISFTFAGYPTWLSADGDTLSGTPGQGEGDFAFTITADDNNGGSDALTVSVTVGTVNDAPVAHDRSVSTAEDEPLSITLTASDIDGDELSFQVVSGPANGQLSGSAPSLTYAPDPNFNGMDGFTFQVSDGNLADTGTVTIEVGGLNDNPVAENDDATTDEDVPVTVDVLTNDSDADGDTLTVASVTQGAYGSVAINTDRTVTYTPDENFNGSDSFTYTISDGNGGSASAGVSVTINSVNDAPVAVADFATVNEGDSVLITVLANDYDVDHDPFWLQRSIPRANGVVAIYDDSTLIYRTVPNFSGDDIFNYYIEGNHGEKVEGTVTVTVTDLNFAPVATDDAYDVEKDAVLVIAAPGILDNDSDPDLDGLTADLVSGPAHGELALNDDGSFTYTPDTGFSGTDSFTYTATDGELVSGPATVTVLVNLAGELAADEPVDPNEGGTVTTDIGVSIEIPGGSLSETVNIQIGTYESIPPGAPQLMGTLYFFGPSGTTFDPPVTITVPYDSLRLPDGFDPMDLVLLIYSEIDGTWEEALNSTVNTSAQTVSGQTYHFSGFAAGLLLDRAPQLILSLPEPVIEEDAQSTVIIENLNDYFDDPNFGDQIDFDVTSPDEGLHALYVTDESALIVDPKPDFYGDIRIVITATDQTGLWVSDTLLLKVEEINDGATFLVNLAETYTIGEDQLLRIHLSADDVEGDKVTFDAASDTSAVTTTIVQDTTLLVAPIQHWYGTAHITVSASDGQDITYLDPFTLTVEAVNDAPSAFTLLEPANAAVIQVQPSDLGDSLTFAWAETVDPDDPVRYAFMLTDSGALYFEYGDTMVNEVRVPYTDILAAIRGQELTSATFWWTIMAIAGQDTIEAGDGPYSLTIDISTLAVADPSHLPQFFALHQNYPNPFNPVTTLQYELPHNSRVLLVIYDMRGREVIRLVDGYVSAGYTKVVWNSSDAYGRPVPSGIYFARLVTSEYTHIIKMSLIR